jgi:hypothetical protein
MKQLFQQAGLLTRRDLLLGAGGMTALGAFQKRGDAGVTSRSAAVRGSARAMILINMSGAPSHVDTFDVKDAGWYPGDYDARAGAGGIVLSNRLFPGLLRNSSDLCFIRSVESWEAEHTRGQFYLQTGHPSNPAFNIETPHFGCIVALERGAEGIMPPFLALNGTAGEGSKFLGGKYEPLAAPANAGGLATLEHPFFGAQSQQRFNERYQFLQDLDASLRQSPFDPSLAAHGAFYDSAKRLMYDPTVVNVFRFATDDNTRYGNTTFGRSCIVARNAIRARAGVNFITINHGGWDMHQRMYDASYTGNIYEVAGSLDTGVSNLIQDLKESGHLRETLICLMGEFGRTPGAPNAAGGRDHHRYAMSVVLAGGGVKGGAIIGSTDPQGERVDRPGWSGQRSIVTEDLTATFFSALGVDYTKSIAETRTGRKFEYVPFAEAKGYRPIDEVFA